MPYPPAPWTLRGDAFLTPVTVPLAVARRHTPSSLKIVPVLPGRTLGGIYLARYGEGSTLRYRELIVFSALVRAGARVGFQVSHIYVDNEASLEGGRAIWGLPKEIAQFVAPEAEQDELVVRQGDARLCSIQPGSSGSGLALPVLMPAFGLLGDNTLYIVGKGACRVGLQRVRWQVPAESPFADVVGQPSSRALRLGALNVVVGAPKTVAP